MLIDNHKIVQLKNEHLLEKLKAATVTNCEIIDSKIGVPTLVLTKNEQQLSYHSRYNPLQEAENLIKNQLVENVEYVLFIGVGLGYSLQEFKANYPNVKFSIYEPNLEVMSCFLNNFNLKKTKEKNLDLIFSDLNEISDISSFYEELTSEKAKIVISPVASQLYAKEIEYLISYLKNYLSNKKSSLATDISYQLRWTMNAIVNFAEVLTTPSLFKDIDVSKFKDKPVLLVAAGPSLDDEIERIRQIKEQKTAYVFAVGSAVNTLINNNILPDVLFSYDPSSKNAKVVEMIKNKDLPIPLIFGSSVGFEVLKDYPGKKVHFITSPDKININLIPEANNAIVPDAPTIAAVALFILEKLGMGPIVLVGQNLSITKEKKYASGIDYVNRDLSAVILKRYEIVKSTTDTDIYVDQSYLEMRHALEVIIRDLGISHKVINTTKNGLPIAGAKFMSLEEVMATYLVENNFVSEYPFDGENHYDVKSALSNFEQLEVEFDKLIKSFNKVAEVEKQIMTAYEKKILSTVGTLFSEYDKYFGEMEHNPFFEQILSRVTKVQYNELLKSARKIRFEKRPLPKMKMFMDSYPKYLRALYLAIYEIQPAFAELKKSDLFKKEESQ